MKRSTLIALAAVATLASCAPALAEGVKLNCRTTSYGGTFNGGCVLETLQGPRVLTDAEAAALKAEDDKWLAFCKPVREPDNEGVIHLRYAKKGCEFGRSE